VDLNIEYIYMSSNVNSTRKNLLKNIEALKKDIYAFSNKSSISKNKLTHSRKRVLRQKGARIDKHVERTKQKYFKKYDSEKNITKTSMTRLKSYRQAIDLINRLQQILEKERDNLLRVRTVNTTFQKKVSNLLYTIKTPTRLVCKAGKCIRRKIG
tara:strand:- start:455 stop:919 length:465 start_codon:yes stop_codon:yes gene_type:complete